MNRFIAVIIVAIIGFIALVTAPAHAQDSPFSRYYDTGNELFENLRSSDTTERMIGSAYVKGVADTGWGVYHCAPTSVTVGQISDIVLQHLHEFTATRHRPAALHVSAALAKNFPCPNKGKGL